MSRIARCLTLVASVLSALQREQKAAPPTLVCLVTLPIATPLTGPLCSKLTNAPRTVCPAPPIWTLT